MLSGVQGDAQEGILDLLRLHLAAVHIDRPALVIGDAGHEDTVLLCLHRALHLGICPFRQVQSGLGKHLIHLGQRFIVKAVDVAVDLLSAGFRAELHRLTGLQPAKLQEEAAVHVVEALLQAVAADLDLLDLFVVHIDVVVTGLLRGEAVVTVGEIAQNRFQYRCGAQAFAEGILHQGRRPGLRVEGI